MSHVRESVKVLLQEQQNQEKLLLLCKPAWNREGIYKESREKAFRQYFRDRQFDALASSMTIPFTQWMLHEGMSFSEDTFWTWAAGH